MGQEQQRDPVPPDGDIEDESALGAEALDDVAGGLIIEPFDPFHP